jgi:hypothetical protein
MRFWEGKNLKKNLETLSKLKAGEKIGFDHAMGLLERHGFGQGIFRALSGDSVLDKYDNYKKILTAIFEEAAAAYGQGTIDLGLIFAAQEGLKTQLETYAGKQADAQKWGSADAYQQKIKATIALVQQVSPKVGGPANARKGAPALPDADDRLPTMEEFDRATKNSKRTPVLESIEFLLEACHCDGSFRLSTDATYQDFYLYGDLYFTCDYWLKQYPQSQSYPFVERLYQVIVRKLCKSFDVSVNVLPASLTDFFGCKLLVSPPGTPQKEAFNFPKSDRKKVKKGVLTYLTRAEARKYRLTFKNGLAYQYPWWREELGQTPAPRLVLAESKHAVELDFVFGPEARFEGAQGSCVLSMSRDIYMYAHRGGQNMNYARPWVKGAKGPPTQFVHSSYLAGDPVLCAGAMSIVRGQVTKVSTASGHYRPSMHQMLNWLECLRMHRVNLERVKVEVYDDRDKQWAYYPAELFLRQRGNVPIGSRIN